MRVAVLADIHANLPALEAVLAEPDVAAADRVVQLGDIALGPLPAETLDLLVSLGDRAVWVHGNCEREIVSAYDGVLAPGAHAEAAQATAALLSRHHRDLLDGRPMTVTLDVDGLGDVLFCHATPRRDDEFVLVDSPVAVWLRALAGVEEQLVVLGHTHMPFDRLVDRRRVVNPGSVGMSYGAAGACWACSDLRSSCAGRGTTYRQPPSGSPLDRTRTARCGGGSTSLRHRRTPRRWRCSRHRSTPPRGPQPGPGDCRRAARDGGRAADGAVAAAAGRDGVALGDHPGRGVGAAVGRAHHEG